MKQYPSIAYYDKGVFNSNCYVFNKMDGSSMRFQWSKKKSFYKFGTKTILINSDNKEYGESIEIFLTKYGDELDTLFRKHKIFRNIDNFTVFGEYFGEKSFSGIHDINDKKDVVLFDVWSDKKGFVPPREFIEIFSEFHISEFMGIYEYNQKLIKDVQDNNFVYPLKEGVVCKGVINSDIWMCKIKTNEWLQKIKTDFGDKALLDEVNGDKNLLNK